MPSHRDGQLAAEPIKWCPTVIGSEMLFWLYLLGMINDESLEECLLEWLVDWPTPLKTRPVTRYDVEESKQYVAIKPYERVQKEWARVVDK